MTGAEIPSAPSRLVAGLGLLLSLAALYWVVGIVAPQIYRPGFLLVSLATVFLHTPGRRKRSPGIRALDWGLVLLTVATLSWPIVDASGFWVRAATPSAVDLALGGVLIGLVLEATRRTVGLSLTLTAALFLVYAYLGPWLDRVGLSLVAHRGYSIERIVGTLYMTFEGIMGVPLDVAATYIVLFTIFGAVVEKSGAGPFFVDWAIALVGRAGGPGAGRAVTLAGYLLGAVSGSGVANTVLLGSVAWPVMRTAGYPPDVGGAVLASAGLGAILAPPVMGAAAFLIAEFLRVSYATVALMAILPAALYYLALLTTVEAESRRLGLISVDTPNRLGVGALTRRGWPYFSSLVVVTGGMVAGMTTFRAVFAATVVAAAVSVIDRASVLTPRRLVSALAAGGVSVVPVVATTAAAGLIVGVVVLTGLGLKASSLIVTLAGGQVLLTVLYAAVAVWLLGLALPVTACYIIAAVMVVPALTDIGIPLPAAHFFVFYYAVLSEVSPPTALSPLAASAVTGGSPYRTTMVTWKYTLPAFLVPLTIAIGAHGRALLLEGPLWTIIWVSASSAIGVVAMAVALAGYWRRQLGRVARVGLGIGSLLLLAAEPRAASGGALLVGAIVTRLWRPTSAG